MCIRDSGYEVRVLFPVPQFLQCLMMVVAVYSVRPVSYTHLDVYKRQDYRKKGFVLFNRNLNVLGNVEHARLEELPLERFNVEEIPLECEIVEEHAGFTDVFFYTDLTNPYAGYVLNLQKLKAYNLSLIHISHSPRDGIDRRYTHPGGADGHPCRDGGIQRHAVSCGTGGI